MVVPSTTHKQFVQVVSAHNARVLLQFLFLLLAALALLRLIAVYWVSSSVSVVGRKWNSHSKHKRHLRDIHLRRCKIFQITRAIFVLSMTKGSLLCVGAQQCAALHNNRLVVLRSNAKMRCCAALCAITAHAHTVQHCVMFIDNDVKHGCQLPVIGSFPVSYTTKEVRWIGKAANNFKTSFKYKYFIIQNA